MTAAPKDKPPREFWLYADFDDTYDTGYSVFTEEQPNITYEIKIHVIEKSAYDALLADAKIAWNLLQALGYDWDAV